MKKTIKLLSLALCVLLAMSLAACGNNTANTSSDTAPEKAYVGIDMSIACLKGPTGVGMTRLMQLSDEKKTANNYTFTVASAPDEIAGKILTGELNIASVPTNLAAKLYKKSEGKITMLAVNTLSVLSIIENGDTIKSVADLKGKTIYSTGEGSNPEYILKYLLKANGIDPEKDLSINFVSENDELIAALVSGKAEIALVPEPVATTVLTKKDTLKRALSIGDEWSKITVNGADNVTYKDSKIMMGCVVALKSYVEQNKEQVDKFLSEYKSSIEYVNTNTDEASILCENYGIIPAAAIAKAAIPNCEIKYIDGSNMENSITGYFRVLFDADPTSIGGAMPENDFYYNAK